jgi:hypothetical protein
MEKKNIQPSLQKSRENKLGGGSQKQKEESKEERQNKVTKNRKTRKEGVLVAEATV